MYHKSSLSLILLVFLSLLACEHEEHVPEPYKAKNDHDAYRYSLEQANLLTTALGKDWQQSSKTSLNSPIQVSTPYQEAFYLDPKEAKAVTYQFTAKRGQKIQISFKNETESSEQALIFVDLFRIGETNQFKHVASATKEDLMLGFEPRADAAYVLRFQPELLRGGNYKVTIENVPTFKFPVAGKNARAIQSVWGDERDEGRRRHEGVDIFAKRGTPILAPTKGYISFVGERGIGGKVVWLKDQKRGQSLYFAHLDKLIAKKGTYVNPGDTLGTVGNTGNARTTPPHLHFGVYKNGAINPFFYLQDTQPPVKPTGNDLSMLGQYARLNRNSRIKNAPNASRSNGSLGKYELAKVVGMNNNAYRIELTNGQQAYISKRFLSVTDEPLEIMSLQASVDLLKAPDQHTFWQSLEAGEDIEVLARHEDYWFVKNSVGETGWLSDDQKRAVKQLEVDPH